jgi:hypothetical protein
MKHLINIAVSLVVFASTPTLATQCKLVDTRNQAVDNHLDITRPLQWASHSTVDDNGDTEVFLYVRAGSDKLNPNTILINIPLTNIGSKWRCNK